MNEDGLSVSRFGRAVKAIDLKSIGISRAGSNPAADVFYYFFGMYEYFC